MAEQMISGVQKLSEAVFCNLQFVCVPIYGRAGDLRSAKIERSGFLQFPLTISDNERNFSIGSKWDLTSTIKRESEHKNLGKTCK